MPGVRTFLSCVAAAALFACAVDSGGGSDSSGSSEDGGFGGGVSVDPSIGVPANPGDLAPSLGRIFTFCGTEEPDENTRQELAQGFEDFRRSGRLAQTSSQATAEIPVFFHVITRGSGAENGEVSDASLAAQIDVLNRAFSGASGGIRTGFQFQLAGINRVERPEWFEISPGSEEEIAMKQELRQGGPETLNVYSTTIDSSEFGGGASGTVLGYAALPIFYPLIPFFDGIVMNFNAFPGGAAQRYNTGNVLVHETGHWLGLLHTFQGECEDILDDLVMDTPREQVPQQGEFCPVNKDTCPNDPGPDPIHNHMTYTEDDCRFEFSRGQVEFMQFNAIAFRLLFPTGG